MKKLLITLGISTLMLFGCSMTTESVEKRNQDFDTIFTTVEQVGAVEFIVKDTNTGCYYIQTFGYANTATYSPYLGEDGKVMGCGQKDFKY